MRAPSRILGQECAELLGRVSLEKDYLERIANKENKAMKPDKTYTVRSLRVGIRVLANKCPSPI